MTTSNQIAIAYDLYRKDQTGKLQPVAGGDDGDLQDAIRAEDPAQEVDFAASPGEQADIVHAHVTNVLPDEIGGHTILFAGREDSKYDPDTDAWIDVSIGASVTYPLDQQGGGAVLFLAVSTANVA